MADTVLLEYMFMFDAVTTWSHLYEFEQELVKFFNEKGLEVETIKTIEGASSRRLIKICRKPELAEVQMAAAQLQPQVPTPINAPQQQKKVNKTPTVAGFPINFQRRDKR